MSSVASPPQPPPLQQQALSPFEALEGGYSQAIAPGEPLVTLGAAGATWWDGKAPVTASLPNVPVDGARWAPGGRTLHVGLGVLDLDQRAWTALPDLQRWGAAGPRGEAPAREVAWLPDLTHVALLVEQRDPTGKRTTEVVIVAATGRERGRATVEGATKLAASADRVLVGGRRVVLLDLDGRVVAEPAALPRSVQRVREAGGLFTAVGAAGAVALLRGDGTVVATWEIGAFDAVPAGKGVVAVDREGTVHVGCVEGSTIREATTLASGIAGPVVQLVGSRIVVAGAGAMPVRAATFTNPCP